MAFVKTVKRNSKKFLYIAENYTDASGVRRQRILGGALGEQGKDITKAQANIICSQHNARPNQFTHTKKTLKEAEEEFRALYMEQIGHGVKKATFDLYTHNVKKFSPIMNSKLKDIDYDAIESLKIQLMKSSMGNRSINLALVSLRKILRFSVRKKYLEYMPDIQVLPEIRHNIDAHTEEEIKKMLQDTMDEKHKNTNLNRYIRIILETGIRPEEVTALLPECLDVKSSTLLINSDRKNKRGRKIPLRPEFAKEWFLWSIEGEFIPYKSTDGAGTMLTRLGQRLGFNCYPKKLRATYASLMVQADVNPFRLAELMGNSVDILQRYYVAHQHLKLREEALKNPFHLMAI